MIKKKYAMFKADGLTRLFGRAPYAHDMKSVARQIAFSFRLLELSRSPFILVVGSYVRKEFVTRYGDFKNGDKRTIGGIERTLFYMRHPEHTYRYATVHQLRELRRTLKQMQDLKVPCSISLEWINERIKTSGKHKRSEPPPCSTPSPFATKGEADAASQWFVDTIEKRVPEFHSKRFRSPEWRKLHSDTMKAYHADPNSIYNTAEYRQTARNAQTQELRDQHSARIKSLHADPNSTYNTEEYRQTHRNAMKTAGETRKRNYALLTETERAVRNNAHLNETEHSRNAKAAKTRHTNRTIERVDLTASDGRFDRGAFIEGSRLTKFPPLASDLTRPELLFHLRWALLFLDLDMSNDLEKPAITKQRPGMARERTSPRGYLDKVPKPAIDFSQVKEKLFGMEQPFLSIADRKQYFPKHAPKAVHVKLDHWSKLYVFAEDVVLTAQAARPEVRGLMTVPYVPKTGLWSFTTWT